MKAPHNKTGLIYIHKRYNNRTRDLLIHSLDPILCVLMCVFIVNIRFNMMCTVRRKLHGNTVDSPNDQFLFSCVLYIFILLLFMYYINIKFHVLFSPQCKWMILEFRFQLPWHDYRTYSTPIMFRLNSSFFLCISDSNEALMLCVCYLYFVEKFSCDCAIVRWCAIKLFHL